MERRVEQVHLGLLERRERHVVAHGTRVVAQRRGIRFTVIVSDERAVASTFNITS
jgi:hypothetical protein